MFCPPYLCPLRSVFSFVQEFGREDNQRISLDAAATTLGVERRRIYDIVNVLESVGIVVRQAKNCYAWRGFTQIHSKLDDLRKKACSDLYGGPEDFRTPTANRKPSRSKSSRAKCEVTSPSSADVGDKGVYISSLETEPDDLRCTTTVRPTSRKEKSLGVLSQRFVQLFLLAGSSAVSLDNAAVQLLGRSPSDSEPLAVSPAEGDASKLLKTKVRRLYDIANILSSLNLIEKVHTANRKPAFKWLGPEASSIAVLTPQVDGNKRPANVAGVEDRARTAVKRRKTFTGANGDVCAASQRGDSAPVTTANISPVSDADNFKHDQGFELDTLNKLYSVIDTFPESYADRWHNYVEAVGTMLAKGQISRERAYESVSPVLKQYKPRETSKNDMHATDSTEKQTGGGHEQSRGLQSRSPVNQRQENHSNDAQKAVAKSSEQRGEAGREIVMDPVKASQPVNNISHTLNRRKIGRGAGAESKDKARTKPKVAIVSGIGAERETGNGREAEEKAKTVADAESKRCISLTGSEGERNSHGLKNEGNNELGHESSNAKVANIGAVTVGEGINGVNSSCNSNSGCDSDIAVARAAAATAAAAAAAAGYGATGIGGSMRPYGWMLSSGDIDEYMRKAREAGPDYYIAAKKWLEDYKEWQKKWSGSITALEDMNKGVSSTFPFADNQARQHPAPSRTNTGDKVELKK